MLSLGLKNQYAGNCLLACLFEGGWEVWPLVAVILSGGWPAREVMTCEGSWNKSHSLHRWLTAAQLSLLAGYPSIWFAAACQSVLCFHSGFSQLSWWRRGSQTFLLLVGWQAFPQAWRGSSVWQQYAEKRYLQYQQLHTLCLGAQLAAAAGW